MIQITEIEESDIPLVQRYASDPKIGETSNVPNPYPANGAKVWYERIVENKEKGVSIVFAISRNEGFAGVISLNNLDLKTKRADIDYWVRADLHNRGIATEAVRKLINYANDLGVEVFGSGCLASNFASQSVLRKNNFSIISTNTITEGKFSGKEFIHFQRICT